MRPSLLLVISICLGLSPLAQAESSQDGGDLFVAAYEKALQGEKAEKAGNLGVALAKLRKAARMLDAIEKKFPLWNPVIVRHRKARTAMDIASVKHEITKGKYDRVDRSASEAASAQLRMRIEAIQRQQRGESVPQGWGELYDPGIFAPLDNPRWRGW